jgi:hypothetical protein
LRLSGTGLDRSGNAKRVFRDRLQRRRHDGILDCAAAEDKALLRSNLSAAAVQWHGDAAMTGRRPRCCTHLRLSRPRTLEASKSRGLCPRTPEVLRFAPIAWQVQDGDVFAVHDAAEPDSVVPTLPLP